MGQTLPDLSTVPDHETVGGSRRKFGTTGNCIMDENCVLNRITAKGEAKHTSVDG